VWTLPGHRDAFAVAGELHGTLAGLVATELARRGYEPAAQIDSSGLYVDAQGATRAAMPADDVARTNYSLSGYGRAQSRVEGELLPPYLPARLGAATGSDATLYVGGWAFAGQDKKSNKAGKVIGTILIVALIAVVIVAIAAGTKGGKGGGGVGKVAAGAGRAAVGVARVAGRMAGRVAWTAARTAGRVGLEIARDPQLFRFTLETLDEMARAGTHVAIYSGRPDYYAEGPRRGRSALFLEMTLVDNHTGRVLWHARQRFPASPEQPAQVKRAVARVMATLPAQ
jgi:hypothetical protein